MADLFPFRAVRPLPEYAERVASVPYDVIDTAEARDLARDNPQSFLHVIRPEIDLPEDTDPYSDAVYARGAENLAAFADGETTTRDDAPALYIYRIDAGEHAQTGIFGCVSVADYDADVILKHEKTRPSKEDDRTRHLVEQRAHAEPVMLTFEATGRVRDIMSVATRESPLYDFTAPDGVQHTIWPVGAPQKLAEAFGAIPHIYVADGHHRCKAASRAYEAGAGGESDRFPAVLFPMDDVQILAYNRVVKQVPGGAEAFAETLRERFGAVPADGGEPSGAGEVRVFAAGSWWSLDLPETQRDGVADGLDVARLSEFILEPMLGIMDVRTDPNIDFVGGSHGAEGLRERVEAGRFAVAFSMHPTQVSDLVAVSDAGELMPPKSTWFEPKLRSGLLVHLF